MTTTPATTTESAADRDDILDGLVGDWLDAAADIEKATARKKELGQQIIDRLPAGQKHEVVPGVGVQVTRPAARYDESTARAVLSAEQLAAITVTTTAERLDFKVAEQVFPGALVAQLKKTSGVPSLRSI